MHLPKIKKDIEAIAPPTTRPIVNHDKEPGCIEPKKQMMIFREAILEGKRGKSIVYIYIYIYRERERERDCVRHEVKTGLCNYQVRYKVCGGVNCVENRFSVLIFIFTFSSLS